MNCSQCREQLTGYIEGLLDERLAGEVALHLQECRACKAEADGIARLHNRLLADGQTLRHDHIANGVMDQIFRQQTIKLRRIKMQKRYGRTISALVAVAAAIAVAFFGVWPRSFISEASAAEVLRQGIAAISNLHSVYLKANIRTVAHDNFELIGLNYDFVPNEMWKQFGEPGKWRIEKPGRVVVMDGESSTLLVKPVQLASRESVNTGFVEWLKPLMDVDKVLDSELRQAERSGWDLQLTHEVGQDGAPKLVVTIEAKAQGDYTNDWLKNKSILGSDTRRVYRFDAQSKLLEDLEVYVHAEKEDVLVLDINEIAYNPEIDPALFSLELPEGVSLSKEPKVLSDNDKYAQMSPQEVARAFFEACANENWDEVLKFWSLSAVPEFLKTGFGGLEIINIGEPFQSGRYPGWFVPYEVKLKSGTVKKHNLAVRNDNPAKRYVVDGGI